MSAPDRVWVGKWPHGGRAWREDAKTAPFKSRPYLAENGPTITAYREALRLLGVDPDSIAREAEKEAQNG